MRYNATVTTLNCIFMYNKADEGGAMYGRYGVDIVNINGSFISNQGFQGGAIKIARRQCTSTLYPGTTCINNRLTNTNCIFVDNYASDTGGAFGFWHGVNCSNINCNFSQNQGMNISYHLGINCVHTLLLKKNHV